MSVIGYPVGRKMLATEVKMVLDIDSRQSPYKVNINKINKTKSAIQNVICRVPQGSVLGPLLFIIYTNDIPNLLKLTHTILFADDTTIFANDTNLDHLYQKVNHDLEILCDWFKANKLSLNIAKTNYMLFTSSVLLQHNIKQNHIKIGN